MNPKTWILQRTLRYIWMLIYGSGDMDVAEDPEIHMDDTLSYLPDPLDIEL